MIRLTEEARRALLAQVVAIARDAGALVMRHYEAGVDRREKADRSPVTIADEEAEQLIVRALSEVAPGLPVVAEESAAAGEKADVSGGVFFLVDPLDGTKEFLSGNGEFTVNIALVEHGVPTLGVVYAPAKGRLFWGANATAFEEHAGGKPRMIATRATPTQGMTAIASRIPWLHDRIAARKLRCQPSSILFRFLTWMITPPQSVRQYGMCTSVTIPGCSRLHSS